MHFWTAAACFPGLVLCVFTLLAVPAGCRLLLGRLLLLAIEPHAATAGCGRRLICCATPLCASPQVCGGAALLRRGAGYAGGGGASGLRAAGACLQMLRLPLGVFGAPVGRLCAHVGGDAAMTKYPWRAVCHVQEPYSLSYVDTYEPRDLGDLHSFVDFVVCLGGDGLLLHAASLLGPALPPVISFKLGSLGFLTTHRCCRGVRASA